MISTVLPTPAGPIKGETLRAIHQDAPAFTDQSTEAAILITGIKVVDLLARTAAIRCSPAWASALARATTSITR